MAGTITEPTPAGPDIDEREEWVTPRVILTEVRSTDKTYDLTDTITSLS